MDLRLPIGLMFSAFGLLLFGYGVATLGDGMYVRHSLGINMNLWWGLALLLFGMIMLALARRGRVQSRAVGQTGVRHENDIPV